MKTNKGAVKTLEQKQNDARAARRRVIESITHEIETNPLRQPSAKWALLLQRALATRQH